MPEKFIWRTAIALHCLPCIVLSVSVIHKYYKNTELGRRYNSATWWFGPLNLLNCISHLGENGALITLSYISSTDNLGKIFSNSIHVTCYIHVLRTCFVSYHATSHDIPRRLMLQAQWFSQSHQVHWAEWQVKCILFQFVSYFILFYYIFQLSMKVRSLSSRCVLCLACFWVVFYSGWRQTSQWMSRYKANYLTKFN